MQSATSGFSPEVALRCPNQPSPAFGHISRGGIIARLKRIAKKYPLREDTEVEALAEMTLSIVEGSMIISALLGDVSYLPRQLVIYRELICHVFSPE